MTADNKQQDTFTLDNYRLLHETMRNSLPLTDVELLEVLWEDYKSQYHKAAPQAEGKCICHVKEDLSIAYERKEHRS